MIKIAHLYYDLMNLYGDSGNVKALKKAIESQGFEVSVTPLTIDDNIDFKKYDVFYIGSGTYNNEKMVLNDLLKYRSDIDVALNSKLFIVTGNALDLFGRTIKDSDSTYKALGLFDFETKKLNKRLVGETYLKSDNFNQTILGFKNQDSTIEYKGVFNIIKGIGFNEKSTTEGIITENFFGTFLIGPVLVRNPELLIYFSKRIIRDKKPNFEFKSFNLELLENAHDEYLKNYLENA